MRQKVELDSLNFRYRGEEVSLPIADSPGTLRRLVRERVVPALEKLQGLPVEGQRGVALSPFQYRSEFDALMTSGMTQALGEFFRRNGVVPIEHPEYTAVCPQFWDLLSEKQNNPLDYWSEGSFVGMTWVLGPMVNTTLLEGEPVIDLVEDERASSLVTSGAIAFDGSLLFPNCPETVTNKQIVGKLRTVFPKDTVF